MTSLYVLVPISVAMVLGILFVFWRALEGGQFDDLDKPAIDVLMDDDSPPEEPPDG
ncbi:MAG: cbb3-type cytochrome oxidase assembly protein CcoS [Betaproteobacteria bacterium]|nr:cbb3-type cytochrome oxidase assembly protein CcoS [Betaproteobacteria bacterium]